MSDTDAMNESTGERLRVALDTLEDRLRAFGAPIVEHLRPGISPAAVRDRFAEHEISAPVELETLWSWHDGTDVAASLGQTMVPFQAETQLVGGWYLMTLDEATDRLRFYRGLVEEQVAEGLDPFPPLDWFPVLHFLDAPALWADCSNNANDPAPLHVVDEFPPGAPPLFGSLAEMVETFVRLFDEGYVRRGERLDEGPSLDWHSLPEDIRRGSAYW